ncbi:ribose-phosphate diphosphokinase [Saccharopolyspora phatthalungensis]|uniref:ribose-phosphate diphosphokinase n=1 Tax=Saccharopolyspora phatthalungensis TaxID=664693 RepID=A0A840Q0G3_9PSEU|nr:ribose-phosphate diphosphokinase [Saccharopolyspora phatthalungensis]MBB5156022.1 ribose-phosphate pyrophosphokinase [Saccharopolyspora phatthalungensis]
MTAQIVAGTANRPLAESIAEVSGARLAGCSVERFPDGELRPVVDCACGADVYVVQPTGPPVNENVVELLLLLDACRRADAARVTAVVPYFGYARQDRRSRAGESVGARVVADAIAGAGADRLIVVDPHTKSLEAMCGIPVEMLTAVPGLAAAGAERVVGEAVVVAPDLGAVKLAEHYAAFLGAPVAVVRKTRQTGSTVRAEELVGDVASRPVLVVDDMISTGATIEAAVHVLLERGALPEITVAATHGPLLGPAADRLVALPLRTLLVTDTLTPGELTTLRPEVHSVAPLLADAISRLHQNQSVDDLLAWS